MRHGRWGALFALFLLLGFVLGGCDWFNPPPALILVAEPATGHPADMDHGLLVSFCLSEASDHVVFNPGDGSASPVYSAEAGVPFCTHVYNFVGNELAVDGVTKRVYHARATVKTRSGYADVTLINQVPVVLPAFTVNSFDWQNTVRYDARLRWHGCDPHTGNPESGTGVYDPDHDRIEWYRWTVTGPNQDGTGTLFYAVYDVSGRNITGLRVDVDDYPGEGVAGGGEAALAIVVIGEGAPTLEGAQAFRRDRPVFWQSVDALEPSVGPTAIVGAAELAAVLEQTARTMGISLVHSTAEGCPIDDDPYVPPAYNDRMTITLEACDSWLGVGSLTWNQPISRGGCSEN